jgi:hypothetical protein
MAATGADGVMSAEPLLMNPMLFDPQQPHDVSSLFGVHSKRHSRKHIALPARAIGPFESACMYRTGASKLTGSCWLHFAAVNPGMLSSMLCCWVLCACCAGGVGACCAGGGVATHGGPAYV